MHCQGSAVKAQQAFQEALEEVREMANDRFEEKASGNLEIYTEILI